ncbi:MAG: DUF1883 domain-containing protein [Actinobacteria bacterium]|uniref:Unannotated protein n=1 Tax=freshwater metagenome TaxID=449393 RepID=A0A6J6AB54_9ZZZZ|nr:DUF1883 domain-containing protein [Actinomycetota bacterium]MSW78871.1 DUF1883 domain-containing protein [Actinomycetota bacterium]MSX93947.1 DUF1883 domain-containing protein [Actinomycetota bacterium]MSZ84439.1 DUF1883 domain-containing protein [Actinomycetota bacterium]MTB19447.1 DUF1883 domain-containing protein [Actinomycetota bacterium]
MSSIHYDFPNLQRGDEIIVTLKGVESNVLLLDPSNLSAFKAGRSYRYGGGLVKRSPFRLVVPSDGHWHVVVQPIGGKVSASAEVRRAPARLPTAVSAPAHSNRPAQAHTITDVGRNLAMIHEDDTDPGIDVFISHASEDKAEVARPLHDLLVGRGLNVWLDEVQLKVGHSLRKGIDAAIAKSRYAVVILSPTFFTKSWTQYELDGIVGRQMNGEQLILPIWHNLSRTRLLEVAPSLADIVALNTATETLEDIAEKLAAAVTELRQA